MWVRSILLKLHVSFPSLSLIYCDNIGAAYLYSNLVFHSHLKHIIIDFYFVHDLVKNSTLRVSHVTSVDQLTDVLTKSLPRTHLKFLMDKI